MPHPALSQDTLFEAPVSEFEAPVSEQVQNATFESTAGTLSLIGQGEGLSTTQVGDVIITVPEGLQATIRLAPPQQVRGPASPEVIATATAEINGIVLSSDSQTTATLSNGIFTLPVRLEIVSPRLLPAGDYAYTVEVLMQFD
jgi:hypothetical protein